MDTRHQFGLGTILSKFCVLIFCFILKTYKTKEVLLTKEFKNAFELNKLFDLLFSSTLVFKLISFFHLFTSSTEPFKLLILFV